MTRSRGWFIGLLAAAMLAAVPAPASPDVEGLHVVEFSGRIAPADRAALEGTGAEVLDYEPHNAYLVWASSSQAEAAAGLDAVRSVGPVPTQRKLSPNLPSSGDVVAVEITVAEEGLDSTRAALGGLGAIHGIGLAGAHGPWISLAATLPRASIAAAAELPGVMYIGRASPGLFPEDEMTDQTVAGNIGTGNRPVPGYLAWLDQHDLDGEGIRVAVVDTGIQGAHPDLILRTEKPVDYMSPAEPVDTLGHGTHVAGIIGGSPPAGILPADPDGFVYGIGVAPATTLIDLNGIGLASVIGGVAPRNNLARFSRDAWRANTRMWNASWHTGEGSRVGYNNSTRTMDVLSRDADDQTPGSEEFLFVFSAGNAGTSGPTVPKEAKNIISVGSTESGRGLAWPLTTNIDAVSSFSSRGPAADGRVFPTVSAPGGNVMSARAPEGALTATCVPPPDGAGLYAACSGTSMAAPHVTGAAALIHQWWKREHGGELPSPAMVRALMVNSAKDIGTQRIPNNNEGWGRINLGNLFGDPPKLLADQDHVFTEAGQEVSYDVEVTEAGPLRATLTWSDAPASVGANPALVNDLDLRVELLDEDEEGQELVVATWRGNWFSQGLSVDGGTEDRRNNEENVFLGSAQPGRYRITVSAFNLPGDGIPHNGVPIDQDFALVLRGAATPAD